jgi:hypothetical protein
VVCIAAYAAAINWDHSDSIAISTGLHLPFVAWAAIGASLAASHPKPDRQYYSFIAKSAETALTGAIYLAAGMVFLTLTRGIFATLGIEFPQAQKIAAWGIGAVPILALASAYDPTTSPGAQNWTTGLARLLKILTQLLLPLALSILAVYTLWFIPTHFWHPFQEREVLIVYNATIMAILALLATVVMGANEYRPPIICINFVDKEEGKARSSGKDPTRRESGTKIRIQTLRRPLLHAHHILRSGPWGSLSRLGVPH